MSIGAMPLPRHQPQKESHCDWYKRAVDSLTQLDNSSTAPLEKPDFLRRRLTAATSEGSGRGRLRGTGGSGGWRSRRSHSGSARGGWVRRGSSFANHAFSGQRGATRVIERFGVSLTRATTLSTRWKGGNAYVSRLSQGCRRASSKRAWGSGIRKQYRGSLALRCVANRSSVGDPHVRSRSLATSG